MNERNYSVVTCCNRIPTENYYCLPQYFMSLQDVQPIVLTEQFGGRWGGLGTKVRWLYKALKEGYITTEYCIFTDCWDFIFAAHPSEMIEKYKKFDCDLVISSERNCFPPDLREEYDKWAECIEKTYWDQNTKRFSTIFKTKDNRRARNRR